MSRITLVLISTLVLLAKARAGLNLNISVIHKKHIDSKLILKNEIHESLDILEGQPNFFISKNGLKFLFVMKTFKSEGRDKLVEIDTTIFDEIKNETLTKLVLFSKFNERIKLETRDSEDSLVDVTLIPIEENE